MEKVHKLWELKHFRTILNLKLWNNPHLEKCYTVLIWKSYVYHSQSKYFNVLFEKYLKLIYILEGKNIKCKNVRNRNSLFVSQQCVNFCIVPYFLLYFIDVY